MTRPTFEEGSMVTIEGEGRPRKVRSGRPDSDGDIKVWNQRETDWSYVHYSKVTPVTASAAPVAPVASVAPQSATTQSNNQEGISTMAAPKVNRSIVRVHLIDEDAGLDVSKALVKDFGTHVLEGSEQELIQEILMDTDANVESALRAHNAVRAKETDLDIRQRTGNEVKLQAIKLRDLSWKVTAA